MSNDKKLKIFKVGLLTLSLLMKSHAMTFQFHGSRERKKKLKTKEKLVSIHL